MTNQEPAIGKAHADLNFTATNANLFIVSCLYTQCMLSDIYYISYFVFETETETEKMIYYEKLLQKQCLYGA